MASLSRLLAPDDVLAATTGAELTFLESRLYGGTFVLEQLWRTLNIDTIVGKLGQPKRGRPRDTRTTERVLFGLVTNRALEPSSKLAAADWISNDVHIAGLDATTDDACYRAMDWLHDVREDLEREVFAQVANLLNLKVDLLFSDTTSTYFELDDADEPIARDEKGHPLADTDTDRDGEGAGTDGEPVGFRTYGKSNDSRDDLPQIVIGMAVTREGISVRMWCWPGNTSDSTVIRQAKDDVRDWSLSKIVWVGDRGFPPRTIAATCASRPAASSASTPPRAKPRRIWTASYLPRCSDPHLSAEDIAFELQATTRGRTRFGAT